MPRRWLLVPSPLLGPSSWGPTAAVLVDEGCTVVIAQPDMATTGQDDQVESWLTDMVAQPHPQGTGPIAVALHSGACPRGPLLVSRMRDAGWPVVSMVLVDGPFPDGRALTAAQPNYADLLDHLVRPDDYLPPWPRWWGSLIEGMVVDDESRQMVLAEARPVPRTLFDQAWPVSDLPADVGRGFLLFGSGYVDAYQQAFDAQWMTMRLEGEHFHQLVAPKVVAAALTAIVAGMRSRRGYPDHG